MANILAPSEKGSVCPECHGALVPVEGEIVCRACGLVVGPSHYSLEDGPVPVVGNVDEFDRMVSGSSPDLPHLAKTRERRLRMSDIISKHRSHNSVRKRALCDRIGDALSLSQVHISTALILFDKLKAKSNGRHRVCDLLGAGLIVASRQVGGRRHMTIASVVEVLNLMGFRTKPRNLLQALSQYKELGLYVGCKSPEEHLEDILSNLSFLGSGRPRSTRMDQDELALAWELSRKILSVANERKIVSNPRSRAACSVYAGFRAAKAISRGKGINISFRRVAEASGLAEYTIRDNFERYFSGGSLEADQKVVAV